MTSKKNARSKPDFSVWWQLLLLPPKIRSKCLTYLGDKKRLDVQVSSVRDTLQANTFYNFQRKKYKKYLLKYFGFKKESDWKEGNYQLIFSTESKSYSWKEAEICKDNDNNT